MDKKILVALKLAFDLEPEEAIKYLESQDIEITWDWRQQLDVIKKHAFTVAKVASADVLQMIHEELQKASAEGIGYKEFQESLTEKFKDAGFEPSKENGAWRLDIIYRTNLQSAYMAGRWNEMRSAEDFAYWQYLAVLDNRTRPAHASLDGKVLRADDPFWGTNYPSNGYRCFPAGTQISTIDGWRNIEDIRQGDLVVGGSGEFRKVTTTYLNSFNGKFVRIISEKGSSVLTTPNHRILTLRGWIKAAHLTADDILINSTKLSPYSNSVITDVDDLNLQFAKEFMAKPGNSPLSPISVALNSNSKIRQENINPVTCNPLIENNIKPTVLQKSKHSSFGLSWKSCKVRMDIWINRLCINFSHTHSASNFWTSCRSRLNKFLSLQSLGFRSFFGLTSPIRLFFAKITQRLLPHLFTGRLTPCFIIDPLRANGIRSVSDLDLVFSQKLQNGMTAHIPSSTQLPGSKVISNIEIEEGFADGAPLDGFDSLDSFKSYALFHYSLSKIYKVEYTNIQNNIDIYNIEVEKDESYITKIGIVHNCRCRVRALDENYVTKNKLKVNKGSEVDFKPDEGFETNPAEAWKPDLTKYFKQLRDELGGSLDDN